MLNKTQPFLHCSEQMFQEVQIRHKVLLTTQLLPQPHVLGFEKVCLQELRTKTVSSASLALNARDYIKAGILKTEIF